MSEHNVEPDPLGDVPHTHMEDDPDAVVDRPIGTRSFIYGTKTLATALIAFILTLASDGATQPAFWTLLSCGFLGVMFSFIERTTTRGVEVVSHRRVNIDVVGTVLLALVVNLVVYVAQR
jgi:hypothetical protein